MRRRPRAPASASGAGQSRSSQREEGSARDRRAELRVAACGARERAGIQARSRPSARKPRDSVPASEQKRSSGARPAPARGHLDCPHPPPRRRPEEASEGQRGIQSYTYPQARNPGGVGEEDQPASRASEFKSTPVRLQGRVQLRDPGSRNSWAPPQRPLRGLRCRGPSALRISSRGSQPRPPVDHAAVCKTPSLVQWRKLLER